ncbi:MAG: hypothetical protein M1816_000535 [Peltula sp. TS41687]|nr:MAG: hypothetical protein M1816_000535 [Peltula sp. TS41687]
MPNKRNKRKNKSKKDKDGQGNQSRPGGEQQLELFQQYLGVRRASDEVLSSAPPPTLDVVSFEAACDIKGKPDYPLLDLNRPAQFIYPGRVIFVAIDLEAYERDHSKITEIGISTLDSDDLFAEAPGEDGRNWISSIRGRHLRIRENAYLRNIDFKPGDPDRFEFGTSEWISIQHVSDILASAFFVGRNASITPTNPADPGEGSSANPPPPLASPFNDTYKVVLVGHSVDGDIAFLKTLGFDVLAIDTLQDVIDVAEVDRVMKQLTQPRSLGSIIYDLGITGWNLHNAGNDAMYTMQAMVRLAIKHGTFTPEPGEQSDRANATADDGEAEVAVLREGPGGRATETWWEGEWEAEQVAEVSYVSDEDDYYGAWGGKPEKEGSGVGPVEGEGGQPVHAGGDVGQMEGERAASIREEEQHAGDPYGGDASSDKENTGFIPALDIINPFEDPAYEYESTSTDSDSEGGVPLSRADRRPLSVSFATVIATIWEDPEEGGAEETDEGEWETETDDSKEVSVEEEDDDEGEWETTDEEDD